ncbi:circadian associated repressor of transcription a isoform X2 [Colossoma macropomum]|uniref:circadian associated repressor of transcription a isoform X2 n=1 Tax=Colossoma macropomum TaxID=42526 RepID=UPI0018652A64|nr:circadian associated repressor of transcription a isoform X2 [Colossoma macropomum]
MQSLGSSSEWPSQAALSSTTRFMFGESDQTEDDVSSEASSEGVVEAGLGKSSPAPFATELPQSPEPHSDCGDQRSSTAESDQTAHCHRSPAYGGLTSVSATRAPTEGDLAFSRKCAELSGYVRPLLELLNGLKTGRYDKGLSTFQQSVAMDRLQRIAGILQKPHLGEKYLRTLLQLEMMLKVWFPHVASCDPNSTPLSQNSTASTQPRWHQNQLPMKKRRLSWSDSESQSPAPPNCKLFRDKEPEQSPCLTTSSAHPKEDTVSRCQGPVISESEGGSCSDTQDCSISSTTSASDSCQTTGRQEAAVPFHTHDQVQGVNGVEPKRRAGRKSHMSEKPST